MSEETLTLVGASAKAAELSISPAEALADYQLCCISREASLIARREVLTGKAKFGISGDGKELPQVALARAMRHGDYRSGYYRDQTLMMALELCTLEAFFAQLYADPQNDPFSGGRQMNSHFATPMIDAEGEWLSLKDRYNVSSDISSTAGQMARGLGLALASKKYRSSETLKDTVFSNGGNEVSVVTIGDASTSEGVFWETINAAAVQQVPLAVCVWDDGYGISVPKKYQTAKESISTVLAGFASDEAGEGIRIQNAKGWDYAQLIQSFAKGLSHCRDTHQPILFHVEEVTQPQGHSTSGSHERYKSAERLAWEKEYDCIRQFGLWLQAQGWATEEELEAIQKQAKKEAKAARDKAWAAFNAPAQEMLQQLQEWYQQLDTTQDSTLAELSRELRMHTHPQVHELLVNGRLLSRYLQAQGHALGNEIQAWWSALATDYRDLYRRHLHSEGPDSALRVAAVPPRYDDESPRKNGYEVLNTFFEKAFARYPELYAFGEDVGHIGGVNQGLAGLQKIYGEERVFDTGIREWTIMGQAIGMAMRGLRPIAEIQYLDYLIYGLQPLTDDLATLRWRSNGQQKAPAIIRTRGHRLEGIWHSGSPLGMLINSLRGIYLCVPRNMVQAVGMYNTLMQSGEPGIVIECLNGYRLKERMPDNIGEYNTPLGVPEVLREGQDVTLLTYGSCVRIAEKACNQLAQIGVSVELIDVQTLLPFDLEGRIQRSLGKTNRLLVVDEDVPGGATAYILQQVLEKQGGYQLLDAKPRTLAAAANRPPYGSDGDYFIKPNVEDIYDTVLSIVGE